MRPPRPRYVSCTFPYTETYTGQMHWSPLSRREGLMETKRANRRGFTMLELMVVMTFLGIVLSIAAPRFRGLENELQNAERETAGFIRQARVEAITTTSAYRVVATSTTRLRAEFAVNCNAAADDWAVDRTLPLNIEGTVRIRDIAADSVLVCFDSRGVGDASPVIRLADRTGDASDIEVFVGGAVRARPAVDQ